MSSSFRSRDDYDRPANARVTVRIPEPQVENLEDLVEAGEFTSRSEAIRAAVRELLNDSEVWR